MALGPPQARDSTLPNSYTRATDELPPCHSASRYGWSIGVMENRAPSRRSAINLRCGHYATLPSSIDGRGPPEFGMRRPYLPHGCPPGATFSPATLRSARSTIALASPVKITAWIGASANQ